MKDIAEQTGLGLATVSSYFNGGNVREKNRIKIEKAIDDLHFEINETARGLKTNRTKTIGVILPELNNLFFAEVIIAAEDMLRSNGYATIVCDYRSDSEREKEAADFLLHRRVDGLIFFPQGAGSEVVRKFEEAQKPVVLLDRRLPGDACSCVLVDNEVAARDAVRRFLAAGHTKIGIIKGPENVYTARERYRGYCRALREAGIKPDEDLVQEGGYILEGGSQAMRKLWEKNPDITAVFASNYDMTVGAMIEINDLGIRVPDQLSVIGFDCVDFARATMPRLSIVTQPTAEMGRSAARILLAHLQNSEKSGDVSKGETVCLETGFLEGESVKQI